MNRRGAGRAAGAPASPRYTALLAVAGGLTVANVYYVQPLLDQVGASLHVPAGDLGLTTTVTQLGYLLGLILVVPLGDLLDRRLLIVAQTAAAAAGLLAVGLSPNGAVFFASLAVVGLASSVVQVIVAYAAVLGPAESRGRVVGVVTGGVVIGILLARTVSGSIASDLGWRAAFLLPALLMAAMAAAFGRLLPRDERRVARTPYRRLVASTFLVMAHDRTLRLRSFFALCLFGSFGALWGSVALPLAAAPWHLSPGQIGLFGLAGAAGALGARGAGRLADGGWEQAITGASLTLLLLSWAAIRQAPTSLVLLVVGIVALDFAGQALHVTNQRLIVEGNPGATSRIIGGYMLCYSLGTGGGAIAATDLYRLAGWSAVSALGAALPALALLVWAYDRYRIRRRPNGSPVETRHPHQHPATTAQGAS